MRWPWRRYAELGRRVEQARAEVERSRRSLHQAREQVVKPSRSFRDRNHFAGIIRDSLLEGRGGS